MEILGRMIRIGIDKEDVLNVGGQHLFCDSLSAIE